MLKFQTKIGQTEITVVGEHVNASDVPAVYEFTRTHPLGTDRATIVADLEAHLQAQGRTDYKLHETSGDVLKIRRYLATNGTDHRQVDYKTGLTDRLEKKITVMYRGEVREVEYHADNQFNDLVLKVQIFEDVALTTPGYKRAANGLAEERYTLRTWYREDGTPDPVTKITKKSYDHDALQQMREGNRRRQNVIDSLFITVLGLLVATGEAADIAAAEAIAMPWMAGYDDEINNYLRTGDQTLRTAILDDVALWLEADCEPLGYPAGTTIRTIITDDLQEITA